jgi:pimeloyl-ACP methyl ester carboxylesterase
MPAPEHGFVEAGGIRYHYLSLGIGRPALLLHGFPENHQSFNKNWQALADAGFQVFVPDLKGYGQSQKPLPNQAHGDYRMSQISLEIRDLVGALGFEKMHIVGHDWGGVILSAMIHQCPEVIDKAVLLNAPFRRFVPWKPRHIYYFNLPWLVERRFKEDPRAFISGILDHWTTVAEAFSDQEINDYVSAFETEQSFLCAMGYYRALRSDFSFMSKAVRKPLSPPGLPETLVIWGCLDPIMPARVGRWAHEDIPGSELALIEDAGHFVHREAPGRVNNLMVKFLAAT